MITERLNLRKRSMLNSTLLSMASLAAFCVATLVLVLIVTVAMVVATAVTTYFEGVKIKQPLLDVSSAIYMT